ncbi:putative prophage protein [Klebsiella variicola]|nr:putative prophage protein [Klebsiella variicola]SLW57838.1 putative prophage protein [Klebsiella variicola]SMA08145.1 putative prophage protein [Klebsiella variicola]SMA10084.1 putative prophage protein [Klebsiella variicola]SMA19721.1 putative prophage protein [Klebsiella variicola]
MTGVELMGFDKYSNRETLDFILQEVWENESWR